MTTITNHFNPDMEGEISEAFAGPRTTTKPVDNPQALTFDHLEVWDIIRYSGREMMVVRKGGDVHEEDGRHIILDAMDRSQPQEVVLHESWVNYWFDLRTMITPQPSTMDIHATDS